MTRHALFVILFLAAALGGCLSTSLSHEWEAPGFSWDTLKRDQILMTPLLDLRMSPRAPAGRENELKFYGDAMRRDYAEDFKQAFFKLRKDIRMFGAGGAFDGVAALPQLEEIGRSVFAKTPLAEADAAAIRAKNQDIRFLFVLAVDREELDYGVSYKFRSDQELDTIEYVASRRVRVQAALWDSKTNQTVWIGTQDEAPSNAETAEVKNPSKRKKKTVEKDGSVTITWVGRPLDITLASERSQHPARFPAFPSRSSVITGSYDDFALGFPIQPSEEKLLEYSYFTYHRWTLGLGATTFGATGVPEVGISMSSIIANRWRVGGFLSYATAARVQAAREVATVSGMGFGATVDAEWTVSDQMRLATGAALGLVSFSLQDRGPRDGVVRDLGSSEYAPDSDAALLLAPRFRLLFGKRAGFQWGGGLGYRLFRGVDAAVLKANRPGPWAAELDLAYASRGF